VDVSSRGVRVQNQFIIIVGDVVDGFEFYGPYPDQGSAIAIAEEHEGDPAHNWVVVELGSTDDYRKRADEDNGED